MALSMFAKCRAPCGDVAATDMKRVPDPVDGVGIEVVERSERSDGRPLLPPPFGLPPCPFLILVCLVTRCLLRFLFFSAPFWLLAPLRRVRARSGSQSCPLFDGVWRLPKQMPPRSVRGG